MGSRGFTLLGVVGVLAVFGVGAAIVAPLLFLDLTVSQEAETQRKLARLVEAVVGVPEEGAFGFIGDVGRLPKSLEELNGLAGPHTLCDAAFNPAAATFHTADGPGSHRGVLGMGWRGPYVKEMVFTDEHLRDAWGNAFRYTCPEATKPASDPTTGGVALTLRTGQLTSAGPDGAFSTADDIAAEPFHDRGHLFVTVVKAFDGVPADVQAAVFFPLNGEQSKLAVGPTAVAGPPGSQATIVLPSVPAGVRFVQVNFGRGAGPPVPVPPDYLPSPSPFDRNRTELFHAALLSNVANRATVVIRITP